MKAFWWSLLGFCVLMCSCASKKVSTEVRTKHDVQSALSVLTEKVKVDTTRTAYTEQVKEHIVIKETINIKEYDKDTGVITKETKTERKFAQSVQADIEKDSLGKVTEMQRDSLEKVENVKIQDESVENSVKNEGINSFWGKFGKYLGIGVSCVVALLLLYLLLKY